MHINLQADIFSPNTKILARSYCHVCILFFLAILGLLRQCAHLLLSVGGMLCCTATLVKAPGLAAVAYHRRRICHSAVSSPQWGKQEVIPLSTPAWQALLVTDFLSVTPGDGERQSSRAPLKPIIQCVLKQPPKPNPTHQMSLIMVLFKSLNYRSGVLFLYA